MAQLKHLTKIKSTLPSLHVLSGVDDPYTCHRRLSDFIQATHSSTSGYTLIGRNNAQRATWVTLRPDILTHRNHHRCSLNIHRDPVRSLTHESSFTVRSLLCDSPFIMEDNKIMINLPNASNQNTRSWRSNLEPSSFKTVSHQPLLVFTFRNELVKHQATHLLDAVFSFTQLRRRWYCQGFCPFLVKVRVWQM